LEKKELVELINSLKNTYDDIIIDSPPVNLVADAIIISHLTDINLFVVRQGFTTQVDLNNIQDLYEKKYFLNTHIVFNGIQKMKHGYGYNYNSEYYNLSKKSNVFSSIFGDFSSRF